MTQMLPRTICSCGFDEQGVTPLAVSDTYTFSLPAFGIRTLMLTQDFDGR